MMFRRELVAGGALMLLWTTQTPALGQHQHRHGRRGGCCVEAEDVAEVMASVGPRITRGSGDPVFDRALARTLSMMTDMFGVLPGFAFFTEEEGEENAYAFSDNQLGREDGTILFGRRMLMSVWKQYDQPEAAIAGICAHEYGHILQYRSGVYRKIRPKGTNAKRTELQGDFLAGYFAGTRKRQNPQFPVETVAMGAYNLGDNNLADPDHHGTPAERRNAVIHGYNAAYQQGLDFRQAFAASIELVMRM